jgi:hypothetical protein
LERKREGSTAAADRSGGVLAAAGAETHAGAVCVCGEAHGGEDAAAPGAVF